MPGLNVMGSVPCACGERMCQRGVQQTCIERRSSKIGRAAYLHVLLGGLLPLLGHGARSHRVGEQAGGGEDGDSGGDNTGGEEEDLAALIGGRGTAGAVGTKGNVVGCTQ